jgi:hypothetical protein
MPKTYEYHEGKKAKENFEKGMEALFQTAGGQTGSFLKHALNVSGNVPSVPAFPSLAVLLVIGVLALGYLLFRLLRGPAREMAEEMKHKGE